MSSSQPLYYIINRVKAGWPDTINHFGHPAGRLLVLMILTTAALFPNSPIQISALSTLTDPVLWAIRALLVLVGIGTLALHRLSCRQRHQRP